MKKEVIIALDFPTLEKTLEFLDKFKEEKLFVKVGMELYLQNGPVVLDRSSAASDVYKRQDQW